MQIGLNLLFFVKALKGLSLHAPVHHVRFQIGMFVESFLLQIITCLICLPNPISSPYSHYDSYLLSNSGFENLSNNEITAARMFENTCRCQRSVTTNHNLGFVFVRSHTKGSRDDYLVFIGHRISSIAQLLVTTSSSFVYAIVTRTQFGCINYHNKRSFGYPRVAKNMSVGQSLSTEQQFCLFIGHPKRSFTSSFVKQKAVLPVHF